MLRQICRRVSLTLHEATLVGVLALALPVSAVSAADLCGPLSGTLGFGGSPYTVVCDVSVGGGDTLDIDPGVEIRFTSGTRFVVDGTIHGNGTVSSPVLLRSDAVTPAQGDWGPLAINGSATLTAVTVRHGDRTRVTGTATATDCSWQENVEGLFFESGGSGSVTGGSFSGNGGTALVVGPGSGAVTVDGASFDGNGRPMYVAENSFPSLSNLTAVNHALHDGVEVESFIPWTASGSWSDWGLPYVVFGDLLFDPGATLTLEAGVVVKVDVDATLTLDGLVTNGTPADPVTFTSLRDDTVAGDTNRDGAATLPSPDDWDGLVLPGTATLGRTTVRYGRCTRVTGTATVTASDWQENVEGLFFESGGSGSVTGGSFSGNGGTALVVGPGSGAVIVDGASFDGNGRPMYVAENSYPSLSNLTAVNHALHDGVEVESFIPWTASGSWSDGGLPYVAYGDLLFDPGATLTLEAGVVVKVDVDAGSPRTLTLDGLVTNGTPAEPVTFTSLRDDTVAGDTNRDGAATLPSPDDWDGLVLPGTAELGRTTVRYGRRTRVTGTATVTASDWQENVEGLFFESGGSGSVTGGSFSGNSGTALVVGPGSGAVIVDGASFDGNGRPMYVAENSFPSLSNLTAVNHALHDGVEVESFIPWTSSGSWSDGGLPYVVFGDLVFDPGATLTLEAGVVVKVDVDAGSPRTLTLDGLVTNGTPADPVTFTSLRDDTVAGDTNRDDAATLPSPDDWDGLVLPGTAELGRTTVRYGRRTRVTGTATVTDSDWQENVEGLFFESGGSGSVTGGSFSGNSGTALVVGPGSGSVIVDGASFDGNGRPMYVAENSFPLLANLVALNHALHDGVEVESFIPWTASGSWSDGGLPYVVFGDLAFDPGATLTLEAGVVVKVDVNAGSPRTLTLDGLVTNGTPTEPVTFTSLRDDTVAGDTNRDGAATLPSPGDWGGVVLAGGATSDLRDTTVRHAADGLRAHGGNLRLEGGRLTRNWTGMLFLDGATGVVTNTEVVDNQTGVVVGPSSLPDLGDLNDPGVTNDGGNQFVCNTRHVDNSNVATLMAENNWWGAVPPDPSLILGAVDSTPFLAGPVRDLLSDLRLTLDNGGTDVRLDWEDLATSCGFRVSRSTLPDTGFADISGPVFTNTLTDAGAGADGQDYFYLVDNE